MTSSNFPLPLDLQFVDGSNGEKGLLLDKFIFIDGDEFVEVESGFLTDFNSVPRGLWNFFPPWQYPEAGVVHDWLYKYPNKRSRSDCDKIHKRIMELKGASRIKRNMAYIGLRAGGWKPWGKYRENDKKAA